MKIITTIAKTKQKSGAAAAALGAKLIREAIRKIFRSEFCAVA